MLEIKINLVNKRDYEQNYNYREIVIRLPKSEEDLKADFNYLALDYNDLSIQDTHVLRCEVIDTKDPAFSASISQELSDIIIRARHSGWTTPFQDIKNIFEITKCLDNEERDKLLAVFEVKREQISNIRDAIKFGNNLERFEFYENVTNAEEYAEALIKNEEVSIHHILEYIDMKSMGDDYFKSENGIFTEQGLLLEKEAINFRNFQKESEEEFEG